MERQAQKRTLLADIFLTVLCILIMLAALEAILRFVGHGEPLPEKLAYRASNNSTLVYEQSPNLNRETPYGGFLVTDEHGFRVPQNPTTQQEASLTIAFVGDSITSGLHVSAEKTFAEQTGKLLLTKTGVQVRVINAGVNGYSARQNAEVVKTKILEHDPSAIVVSYSLNDPTPSPEPMRWFSNDNSHQLKSLEFIYSLVRDTWLSITFTPDHSYWTRLHENPKTYSSVLEAFEILGEISKHRGIPVYLVIFPMLKFDKSEYEWSGIHEQVSTDATRRGLQVIDLKDRFIPHGHAGLRANPRDLVHPNALGHSIAAEAIAQNLENKMN